MDGKIVDEAVEELTDADVGLHSTPDLSPLERAFGAIADDLGEKNARALTSSVKASMEKIDGVAKDIASKNAKVVEDVQEAMKKIVSESGDGAAKEMQRVVSEALSQIKMPDVSEIGAEVARAVTAMETAQTRSFEKVSEALREVADAVAAMREEPETETEAPAPPPRRWFFDFQRNDNGEIIGAEAIPAEDAPRTALEAAQKASER